MPVMNDYETAAAIRSLPDAWEKRTGNIEREFCYDRNEIYISEATAVCGCVGFYSRADRSASYPDCNGTYEEQKTETYAGRTDGVKTAFGHDVYRFYGCLLC